MTYRLLLPVLAEGKSFWNSPQRSQVRKIIRAGVGRRQEKRLSKSLATREQGPESEPQDSGEKPGVVTHTCDRRAAEGRGRRIPGSLHLAKSLSSGFHERPCLKE